MYINFATTNRSTAHSYIQKVYDDLQITDTDDCAKPMLDLVEKNLLCVQDPAMYGSRIAIQPTQIWDEKYRVDFDNALMILQRSIAKQQSELVS
jgi:hypothetical protein